MCKVTEKLQKSKTDLHVLEGKKKMFCPIFVTLSLKKKGQVVDGLAAVRVTSALPL